MPPKTRTELNQMAPDELRAEVRRLEKILNTPKIEQFSQAVRAEAAHQAWRWEPEHDAGNEPEDWFWLIGFLAGKALRAHREGDRQKALHHTISTSAALNHWHMAIQRDLAAS